METMKRSIYDQFGMDQEPPMFQKILFWTFITVFCISIALGFILMFEVMTGNPNVDNIPFL